MRMVEDVFQTEGKERKDQKKSKICQRKSIPSEEDGLARDSQLCLGQWQWTRRGLWQPQKIQQERRGSRKTNGTWVKQIVSRSATQGL